MPHPTQRYVSPHLTHFAGKDLPDEDARYQLLVKILKSGELLPKGDSTLKDYTLVVDPERSLCDDEMYITDVVCFCDIPVADLHIHMGKYSRFGLAFSKRFLVRRGASPVFYVARDAIRHRGERLDQTLDSVAKEVHRLHKEAFKTEQDHPGRRTLLANLGFSIFGFIKGFESSAVETEEANYYMEREWRVLGCVEFKLSDVRQVIMPRGRFSQFRKDVTDYTGELIAALSV